MIAWWVRRRTRKEKVRSGAVGGPRWAAVKAAKANGRAGGLSEEGKGWSPGVNGRGLSGFSELVHSKGEAGTPRRKGSQSFLPIFYCSMPHRPLPPTNFSDAQRWKEEARVS